MTAPPTSAPAGGTRPPLDHSTQLALERTRLAHERTLMAWVRTATSLISFGFTIHKFFQYLREQNPNAPHHIFGPRDYAVAMIALGIGSLVLATIQHRRDMQRLRAEYGSLPLSTAAVVAIVVSGLGIVALVLVYLGQ
jgi:putative membrane protein